jgi:hypothetical protein
MLGALRGIAAGEDIATPSPPHRHIHHHYQQQQQQQQQMTPASVVGCASDLQELKGSTALSLALQVVCDAMCKV